MNHCKECGKPVPRGFSICWWCEPFEDDNPLPMATGFTPEDARLTAMDDESDDGDMGYTYWDKDAA